MHGRGRQGHFAQHYDLVYFDQWDVLFACRKRPGPILSSLFWNFHQQAVFAIPMHYSIFFSQIECRHRKILLISFSSWIEATVLPLVSRWTTGYNWHSVPPFC